MELLLLELASVVLGVAIGYFVWSATSADLLALAGSAAISVVVIGLGLLGALIGFIGFVIGLFVVAAVVFSLLFLVPFAAGIGTGSALRRYRATTLPQPQPERSRALRGVDPRSWEDVRAAVLSAAQVAPDPGEELTELLRERAETPRDRAGVSGR